MRTISLLTLAIVLLSTGCKKETKPCPKGYEGTNCDQEITPTKMVINKFEITKIPAFKSNSDNWDVFGGKPDIFIQITDDVTKEVIYKSPVTYNHNTTDVIKFEKLSIIINNPNSKLLFSLYDEDSGSDEFMSGIIFTPYKRGLKFPEKYLLDCTDCKITANLYFEYLF